MKAETKKVAKAVGAVVAGAAIGYVAGTLTAPDKGTETRKRIGRKIEEEAKVLTRKTKDTMKGARVKIADAIHG